jgi:exodeoxyribonuclease VII small subunit
MAEKKFEEALARLESIVEKLEGEDLSLEKSIKAFEEGVRLSLFCDKKLNEAQKKIEILLKDVEGRNKTEPFDLNKAEE